MTSSRSGRSRARAARRAHPLPLLVAAGVLGAVTACSAAASSPAHTDPTGSTASGPPVTLAPCTAPQAHAARTGGLADITLNCLGTGPAVDVAELAGPAVVNLWASWCYPCRAEMPLLDKASTSHQAEVNIVGVDTNDQAAKAVTFAKQTVRAGYEELSDPTGKLAAALHAPGLPYTVAIDRAGVIVWRHAGKLTSDDIADAIHDALKGS